MKLILIGFGVVGQGFAGILRDKAAELQRKYNFSSGDNRRSNRQQGCFVSQERAGHSGLA